MRLEGEHGGSIMPYAPAPPLQLRASDRQRLEAIVRKRTAPQRDVLRARIILLCADGVPHRQIKGEFRTSVDAIVRWRGRYRQEGLDGLKDRPRSGRPPLSSPGRAI
ncbi:MAG: helix-turn-helix domain-containing protein [Planctomycetota bacterium]